MTNAPSSTPAPATPPSAPSGGGASFLDNLFKPVSDKANAMFESGKNKALSFTTARPGAATEAQLGDSLVYSMTDFYNGIIGNLLQTGSEEAQKLYSTGNASVMAIANPLARLLTLHPVLALKEAVKAPVVLLNEGLDAVTSTIGNLIKGTRNAIEGCLRRPLDRVATQLGRIPIAGRFIRPTINVTHRLFGLPLEIIEGTRARIGAIGDKIFGWIRSKVPVGGGGGGTPAHAPAAAH